jgi:hypothetical protein
VIKRILLDALTLALACTPPCSLGQAAAGPVQQISLNQYTQQLDRLRTVADACAQNPAPGTCDPSLVGPDVMVSIPAGKRIVNFAWLRDALRLAASARTSKNKQNAEKEASSALGDARSRLAEMIQETASPPTSVFVPGNVSTIRRKLDGILESGEYPQAKAPTLLEKIWGDFLRWLLNSIIKAMPSGSSPSAIYLLELTVIAIPMRLADLVVYPQAAGAETWTIRR